MSPALAGLFVCPRLQLVGHELPLNKPSPPEAGFSTGHEPRARLWEGLKAIREAMLKHAPTTGSCSNPPAKAGGKEDQSRLEDGWHGSKPLNACGETPCHTLQSRAKRFSDGP